MSKWPTVRLSAVADIIMGQSPPGDTYNETGDGLPFFQGKAEFTEVSPTPKKWCKSPKKIAEAGDILISVRAPVGPTNLAATKCCIGRGLAAIRADQDKLDSSYLRFALRHAEPILASMGQGSTFAAIGRTELATHSLLLPPITEQRRIVDILSRAEGIVRLRREALKKTEEIIPALFLDMFGDPATNPKEWPVVSLEKTISIIVPTRDKPRSFSGDIPWVTIPDLTSIFVSTAKNKLTHEEARNVGNRLMPKGTVLLSCAGTLGKVGILTGEAYANQQLYGLVPNYEKLISEYLAVALQQKGESFYRGLAGTSTLGFFSKARALSIEIPVPPIQEQIDFSRKLEQLISIQSQAIRALATAETTFQSLLHRAFSGEL